MSLVPKANDWRPSAQIETLKARAIFFKKIRAFFDARQVIEVETPVVARAAATDCHLAPMRTTEQHYLQTSPEFHMKRLLCAGMPDCYQMAKAFRSQEQGVNHNPEFTLLEWYRLDWDETQLAQETLLLCQELLKTTEHISMGYEQACEFWGDYNPFDMDDEALRNLAKQKPACLPEESDDFSRADWLDVLFSTRVQPHLAGEKPLYHIYDFPVEQAALSQIIQQRAKRFELFYQGVELANGYRELTCPIIQSERFVADNQLRADKGLPQITIDQHLIDAMAVGLPTCAGVAVGLDRLFMLKAGLKTLKEGLSFHIGNA